MNSLTASESVLAASGLLKDGQPPGLTAREWEVLDRRINLRLPYEEIGHEWGLTRERVRQIAAQGAIRLLRRNLLGRDTDAEMTRDAEWAREREEKRALHVAWRAELARYHAEFGELPTGLRNALAGVVHTRWGRDEHGHRVVPTLEMVRQLSDEELLAGENFGKKSLVRLREWLAAQNGRAR